MTNYHIAPHKPTIVRIGDGNPPAYAALGGDTPENLRDHAEFIVLACNSHAKLVEALESITNFGGTFTGEDAREMWLIADEALQQPTYRAEPIVEYWRCTTKTTEMNRNGNGSPHTGRTPHDPNH
jgi:hypothetical protein